MAATGPMTPHEAVPVSLVEMQTNVALVPLSRVSLVLPPLVCTTTLVVKVAALVTKNWNPSCSVDTTGNTTVCAVVNR